MLFIYTHISTTLRPVHVCRNTAGKIKAFHVLIIVCRCSQHPNKSVVRLITCAQTCRVPLYFMYHCALRTKIMTVNSPITSLCILVGFPISLYYSEKGKPITKEHCSNYINTDIQLCGGSWLNGVLVMFSRCFIPLLANCIPRKQEIKKVRCLPK